MAKTGSMDMTVGNPLKTLLLFSVPMLIGNVIQLCYSIVDSIVVGRFVSVRALAAIGSTGGVLFLMISFIIGLTMGISIITAQYFGAKNENMLKNTLTSAIYISLIAAVVLGIAGIVASKPLLLLMNTPADIMEDAMAFLRVTFATAISPILYNMLGNMIRSMGDSKTPLYALIISSLTNIVLVLFVVLVLHMGVAGVALATGISQFVSVLYCAYRIYKKYTILHPKKENWKMNGHIVANVLKIGIPMSLQNVFTSFGMMAVQGAINGYGSDVVAGYSAASRLDQVATMPLMTIGSAISTFAGQNLGAGKIERIHDGVKKALLMAVCICAVMTVLMIGFGKYLVQMFVSVENANVIEIARGYLTTVSIFYIFGGVMYIYTNVLRGVGKVIIPMIGGFLELGAKVTAAFVLSSIFSYSGIWFAWPIAWILSSAWMVIYFYSGRWKKQKSMITGQPVDRPEGLAGAGKSPEPAVVESQNESQKTN